LKRKDRARQIIVYTVYILFFTILQVTFSQNLSFLGQVADFMLVIVVLSGYFFGSTDGMIIGASVGFLRDYFSGSTIGIGILIFMYIGVFSSTLFRQRFHKRVSLAFLQIVVVTFIYKFAGHTFFFIRQLFMERSNSYLSQTSIWLYSILPQIGVNLLAAVPMILLLYFAGPYKKDNVHQKNSDMYEREFSWQIK